MGLTLQSLVNYTKIAIWRSLQCTKNFVDTAIWFTQKNIKSDFRDTLRKCDWRLSQGKGRIRRGVVTYWRVIWCIRHIHANMWVKVFVKTVEWTFVFAINHYPKLARKRLRQIAIKEILYISLASIVELDMLARRQSRETKQVVYHCR